MIKKYFNLTMCLLAFLCGVVLLLGFTPHENKDKGQLVIQVDNISQNTGIIWVGIYNSVENYLVKEKAIVEGIKVSNTESQKLVIEDLPYGTYAVALFHDINANGEMDRNLLGIPSEPYAFSQKPKSKWRIPKFEEVKFTFSHHQQQLHTTLIKWWQ